MRATCSSIANCRNVVYYQIQHSPLVPKRYKRDGLLLKIYSQAFPFGSNSFNSLLTNRRQYLSGMSSYEALKSKWQKRQDTDTVVFGASRDEAISKLKKVRLPPTTFFSFPTSRTMNNVYAKFYSKHLENCCANGRRVYGQGMGY